MKRPPKLTQNHLDADLDLDGWVNSWRAYIQLQLDKAEQDESLVRSAAWTGARVLLEDMFDVQKGNPKDKS